MKGIGKGNKEIESNEKKRIDNLAFVLIKDF